MSVIFTKNGNVYTIQDGSTTIILDEVNKYINYITFPEGGGSISATAAIPTSTSLFSYSTEVIEFNEVDTTCDVYDFKGNTIMFGGRGLLLEGLFNSSSNLTRFGFIKNLNLRVIAEYSSISGYLFSDFTAGNTLTTFIENCTLDVNFTITTPGLIGEYFSNGSITGCSFTSSSTLIANLSGHSGAICGRYCGFADGTETNVVIKNCYSTVDMNSLLAGGICGNNCGGASNAGSSNVLIENCYSTGIMDSSVGGIVGGNFGTSIGGSDNTCNVTIISCYSTGVMSGPLSGGICSAFSNNSGEATTTCNLTITSCYSIGDIEGSNSGGIVGYNGGQATVASATTNMYMTSCYSLGAITGDSAGGICGAQYGFDASSGSNIAAEITCCYTLNGVGLDDGYAQGEMFGNNSVIDKITSVNNSFSVIVSGDGDIDGKITINELLVNCEGYEPRCISNSDGESALILTTFLSDNWRIDNDCLNAFSPLLAGDFGKSCPIETTSHKSGTDGTDGWTEEWPVTNPDTTIILPCKNDLKLSRHCNDLGIWDNVEYSYCGTTDEIGTSIIASIVIVFTLFFLFFVYMFYI